MEKEQEEDDAPSPSFPVIFRQCCPDRPTRSKESDHSDSESLCYDERKIFECDVTNDKRDRRISGIHVIDEVLNSHKDRKSAKFTKSETTGQCKESGLSVNLDKTNDERKDLAVSYHIQEGNNVALNEPESLPKRLSIVKCETGDHLQETGTKLLSKGDTRRRPSRLEKLKLIGSWQKLSAHSEFQACS